MPGQTLFDKIWDRHVIADLGDGYALLHISRHLMHDGGGRGLQAIKDAGYRVRNPDLTFATFDHVISTEPGRTHETLKPYAQRLYHMRDEAKRWGIKLFDLGQPGQGIVHVMGPEQGVTLPGTLLVCGDSHTCTHGGMGAIAFGVGATEVIHVLATQSLVQPKPKRMRVTFDGKRAPGVTPKDMILHLIGQIGAAGGTGYAVEYAGSAIRDMEVEGRLTACNLSIELGAKIGMVAPDDVTFKFLKDRPYAPKGALWDQAVADWRTLASDADAVFDAEVRVDVNRIVPQITWGTSPEHVIPVTDRIPDPAATPDPDQQKAWQAALDYMGLTAGAPIQDTRVDWVFIGSCTNSRMSDLRDAAQIAKGRKVRVRIGRRGRIGNPVGDGDDMFGAGAPGDLRHDPVHVDPHFGVEHRIGIAGKRAPVGDGLVPQRALGRVGPVLEELEGDIVGRHHADLGAELDREIARREPAFDLHVADRAAGIFDGVARAARRADLADECRIMSLGVTPGARLPSKVTRMRLGLGCTSDCVASTAGSPRWRRPRRRWRPCRRGCRCGCRRAPEGCPAG